MSKTNIIMSVNQLNVLSFKHLAPEDQVTHGFFGRQGGVSTGIYSSLNCSPQSKDDAAHIHENRDRILAALKGEELSTLKQTHSPICLTVRNSCTRGIEEGDALVTKTPGQVIGCLTADCGPVLFYGTDRDEAPVIGVSHAGWGGALKGVIDSTVNGMIKLGADVKTIRAAIGPCIGQASYEVAQDFKIPFLKEDRNSAQFFRVRQDGKFLFDLQGYIKFRLNRMGVDKVISSNRDTYVLEQDYFSYRRATHRREADYGRQISAISIRTA